MPQFVAQYLSISCVNVKRQRGPVTDHLEGNLRGKGKERNLARLAAIIVGQAIDICWKMTRMSCTVYEVC